MNAEQAKKIRSAVNGVPGTSDSFLRDGLMGMAEAICEAVGHPLPTGTVPFVVGGLYQLPMNTDCVYELCENDDGLFILINEKTKGHYNGHGLRQYMQDTLDRVSFKYLGKKVAVPVPFKVNGRYHRCGTDKTYRLSKWADSSLYVLRNEETGSLWNGQRSEIGMQRDLNESFAFLDRLVVPVEPGARYRHKTNGNVYRLHVDAVGSYELLNENGKTTAGTPMFLNALHEELDANFEHLGKPKTVMIWPGGTYYPVDGEAHVLCRIGDNLFVFYAFKNGRQWREQSRGWLAKEVAVEIELGRIRHHVGGTPLEVEL